MKLKRVTGHVTCHDDDRQAIKTRRDFSAVAKSPVHIGELISILVLDVEMVILTVTQRWLLVRLDDVESRTQEKNRKGKKEKKREPCVL